MPNVAVRSSTNFNYFKNFLLKRFSTDMGTEIPNQIKLLKEEKLFYWQQTLQMSSSV